MGTFIKLPGVSAPDRPQADIVDGILPDSGALYLFEFGHSSGGFPAGIPASGTKIRNLAGSQAASLIETSQALIDGDFTWQGLSGTSGQLERSAKGGVHAIMSQTTAPVTNDGVRVGVPAAILDYIAANPTHMFFASMWGRITRAGNAAMAWSALSLSEVPSGSELLFSMSNDGGFFPTVASGNNLGYMRTPQGDWRASSGLVAPQGIRASVGIKQYTGTPSATRQGKAMGLGSTGPQNSPFVGSGLAENQISGILYRAYLEDLTISGRSYNTVEALDSALYASAVATPGGRYYGDTYTDPTAIP